MAGQLHPVGAHLSRDRHQRCAVQIGIRHAGDKIGGTGAQGGQADTGPAGQAAVDVRHKVRALHKSQFRQKEAFFRRFCLTRALSAPYHGGIQTGK